MVERAAEPVGPRHGQPAAVPVIGRGGLGAEPLHALGACDEPDVGDVAGLFVAGPAPGDRRSALHRQGLWREVVVADVDVALSSTTWHFASKADILEAALHWTARREAERIRAIADRLGDTEFDPSAWAEELGDWLLDQVTNEREFAVALYRLQVELLGSGGAPDVHREWSEGLRAVGERVLERSSTTTPELDVRLVVATLDGLRMGVLNSGEQDVEWLRLAVRRQLQALLG